jgi:hypothetical protein
MPRYCLSFSSWLMIGARPIIDVALRLLAFSIDVVVAFSPPKMSRAKILDVSRMCRICN